MKKIKGFKGQLTSAGSFNIQHNIDTYHRLVKEGVIKPDPNTDPKYRAFVNNIAKRLIKTP